MSDAQMLLIIGLVYVAPHINKHVSLVLGIYALIGAAVKGLMP